MLDIDYLIRELEKYGDGNIKDAAGVCRMWKHLKKDYGRFDLREKDGLSDIPLAARMKGIEIIHFPQFIYQTLKVAVHGRDDKALHNIRERILDIWGVTEVRP